VIASSELMSVQKSVIANTKAPTGRLVEDHGYSGKSFRGDSAMLPDHFRSIKGRIEIAYTRAPAASGQMPVKKLLSSSPEESHSTEN
jgi:hypothetical protein